LSAGSVISVSDIGIQLDAPAVVSAAAIESRAHMPPPFPCVMDELESWSLEQALQYCGGKRMKTAAMLGMNYYTFRRRLEKHGITAGEE
ncbi:MAG: hypothetical protein J0665_19520, partial [Deltaproteobacteria bacterium]|nr:hypothetical protein [Deltaproteobacteria bacterium]